jgi:phosphoserine phosphatase
VQELGILFDCDNTLIDNDRVKEALNDRLSAAVGAEPATEFWLLYEEVRAARDLVDIPATIDRFVEKFGGADSRQVLMEVFFEFPFADYVYPAAADVIRHADTLGLAAVLSDGDQVYQRHKIEKSGLAALVGGRVIIVEHKEFEVPLIDKQVPARRLAVVDDKPRLLRAFKTALGRRVTTVFVRQGKYAWAETTSPPPQPDITLESIGEFTRLTEADLAGLTVA